LGARHSRLVTGQRIVIDGTTVTGPKQVAPPRQLARDEKALRRIVAEPTARFRRATITSRDFER